MSFPDRTKFLIYERLAGTPHILSVPPRLASWDKSGSPSQIALAKYLDHACELLGELPDDSTALSIELTVGFDSKVPLAGGGRDLDNYLYPLVHRLGWKKFLSVSATKCHGPSKILIGQARPGSVHTMQDWNFASVETKSSTGRSGWKHEIVEQLRPQVAHEPTAGALAIQLCFRVAGRRNWSELWKPAIDSLGAILGEDTRGRPFNPNDDRVVNLRLYRVLDDALGNNVQLGIWWRSSVGSDAY